MNEPMPATNAGPNLFPTFDSIELVLWPALVIGVFVATAVAVDAMVNLASRLRLVDLPARRGDHALPTPRGGGIAVALITILAALTLVFRWPAAGPSIFFGILLPAAVVAVAGIVDDMHPLRPWLRLATQLAVAAWITAVFGPLSAVSWPGLSPVPLGTLGWPLTVIWIVAMIRAFGLMDGSDGIAGLGGLTCGLALAVIALAFDAHVVALLAGFTAAAAGGFLVFNWPPTRVLLGSVGSGFLGTILATLPLVIQPPSLRPTLLVPIAMCLWPCLLDPLLSVIRRLDVAGDDLDPHRTFSVDQERRTARHALSAGLCAAFAVAGAIGGVASVASAIPPAVRAALPMALLLTSIGTAAAVGRRTSPSLTARRVARFSAHS